jgi:hypothetical protein
MPVSISLFVNVKNYLSTKAVLMERKMINDITVRWKGMTWKVIELNNINIVQLQCLFMETYDLLDLYSRKVFARKELTSLLLEMQEFSWWVCTLPDTPFHHNYQQVMTLIQKLTEHFLGHHTNRDQIELLIDQL